MAYGLTNAKGASGSKAELIWSGSADSVTIDYGNYSQLIVCNKQGKVLINVPTTDAVGFIIGKSTDTFTGEVCFGFANLKGSVSLTGEGYANLANGYASLKPYIASPLTEIYGIKEALV